MKKLGIAILGLAIFVMAALPNQAKAFTVNGTDVYLVISGGPTNEYYYDLGTVASVLTSGVSVNFSNLVAGTSWSIVADPNLTLGTGGNVYFTSQSPNAATISGNSSVSIGGMDSAFGGFAAFNTSGTSSVDFTQAAANSNSYLTNMGNAGTFGSSLPAAVGTTNTAMDKNLPSALNGNTAMNIYYGLATIPTDAIINFSNMIATVKNLGTNSFNLTIAGPTAVPLPPSLVMFVTGLIALGLIARRKQAGF